MSCLLHRGVTLCERRPDATGILALDWAGEPICARCAEILEAALAVARDPSVPEAELHCPGCVERRFAEDFGIRDSEGPGGPPVASRARQRPFSGHHEATVTVCSACLCASCWQGVFYCERSRSVGTVEKTVAELRALGLEHERFWKAR